MRRRDFLKASAAAAATSTAPLFAQPRAMVTRGAIVIGVDRAGDLPRLRAAATGAQMITTWLRREEGFEVKEFIDTHEQVRAGAIYDGVAEFVRRGTLDQLVIYFAGHGFLNGYSEHWMLSQAPENPNEAISLIESVSLAKECGIPNVVFISDACRSSPDSLGAARVRGSFLFPNRPTQRRGDVDKFLATLAGDAAYEGPVHQSSSAHEAIYTSCFLEAFSAPYAEMVKRLPTGEDVVPNRQLKGFLEREVPKKAQARSIQLRQMPDADVVSSDLTYIGKALGRSMTGAGSVPPPPNIADAATLDLRSSGLNIPIAGSIAQDGSSNAQVQFALAKNVILKTPPFPASFGFGSPDLFVVSGANIVSAAPGPGMAVEVLSSSALRVIFDNKTAGSIAVHFANGTGTVLGAFRGYSGTVTVDGGAVTNVTYLREGDGYVASLHQLRAAVATAARFGVFRIEGDRETRNSTANELGNAIRVEKRSEPTLALYAAYAFDQADLIDQVRAVRGFMLGDLHGAELFDVAMLSGTLSNTPVEGRVIAPFCPMLSQGWGLLRVRGVRLPEEVDRARDHLRPALWTTFDATGMEILSRALRAGRLI